MLERREYMDAAEAGKLLDHAWSLRMNGESERCLVVFNRIRKCLSLLQDAVDGVSIEKILESPERDVLIDAVILECSLLRLQKRKEESLKLMGLIENALSRRAALKPYWLLFERGMHFLHAGDNSLALECFGLAVEKSRNSFEKLCAKSNFTCCLHHLGLPYSDSQREVEALLEAQKENPFTKTTHVQQQVLSLFRALQVGNFKAISKISKTVEDGNQAHYVSLWALTLPYHSYYESSPAGLERFARTGIGCREYAYRNRTLLGLLHPADENPSGLSDWADRLYLWVWRWLMAPSAFPIERVLATLTPLKQPSIFYRLNAEDRQLVRNSVLWLALFDASSRRSIESLLQLVAPEHGTRYPLFETEEIVIHYWMAIRNNELVVASSYLELLGTNPLYKSDDLFFRCLVDLSGRLRKVMPGQLAALIEHLLSLKNRLEQQSHPLVVDLSRLQVLNRKKKTELVSEPICLALELLRPKGVVTIEELMAGSYGISRFDPVIHHSKIFALLSRMKNLCKPYLRFRVKSGRIYADGDWSQVLFINAQGNGHAIFREPKWRELVYSIGQSSGVRLSPPLALSLGSKTSVTRTEIQKLCGKSRATVNRLLLDWEKKGWVKKIGKARSTRYTLSQFLQNQMKEATQ